MMAAILCFLMLLVWLALVVYHEEAPRGCCMLVTAPFIWVLMLAICVLSWVGTWGQKTIRFEVEEVQS